MADAGALTVTLTDGIARLEPIGEEHREAVRAACAADADIWKIYPTNWRGSGFDAQFDVAATSPDRCIFAAFAGGVLVGFTGYLAIAPTRDALEIGSTYLAPDARGTGLNRRLKALLIDHAIACGFQRIEFRVDARNGRSQAAVLKLGAVREGLLRRERKTWTGHVRDTAIFSILADEWQARR